jgi:hypothetical protein
LYEHDRNVESEIKNGKNERCKIFEYFLRAEGERNFFGGRSWGRLQDLGKKTWDLKELSRLDDFLRR